MGFRYSIFDVQSFMASIKKSFTIQHELEDAQDAFIKAIYRFREAERTNSNDYCSARSEMNRLEKRIQDLRYLLYQNHWQ